MVPTKQGGANLTMQQTFTSSSRFRDFSSKSTNTLRLVSIAGFIALTGSTLSLIAITINAIIAYFAYKNSFDKGSQVEDIVV
ncbi:hypothetical protein GMB86_06680 [Terrilactibacillus sp. BCM23-1]|uniref:Uncharacterized protein n=1 Tax=Terrilactibacillus tamarindi TaxID=2599694 RepID=A0A6N8CR78_9BACI|nr:hypothetical protein [Terrilactibacillus tamarindi]MTT31697.1 hypothetical protein [Terrilactibacillus tamarindi]